MLLAFVSTNNFYASDKQTLREKRAIKLNQVNQRRRAQGAISAKTISFDEAFKAAYAQLMSARTVRDITAADLGIAEIVDTQLKYVQQPANGKQNQKKSLHHRPTIINSRD